METVSEFGYIFFLHNSLDSLCYALLKLLPRTPVNIVVDSMNESCVLHIILFCLFEFTEHEL